MADRLNSLLALAKRDSSVGSLLSLAEPFRCPPVFIALIDEVLELPEDHIYALSRESYWHANGFSKLVLYGSGQEPRIRVHHWPSLTPQQPFHSHSWNFSSMVVFGSLYVERASVSVGNGDASVYRVPNKDAMLAGADVYHEADDASAVVMETVGVNTGDPHSMVYGDFHSVRCTSSGGAISLVFQGTHETWFSKLVVAPGHTLHDPYDAERFTTASYTEALIAVRQQVANR